MVSQSPTLELLTQVTELRQALTLHRIGQTGAAAAEDPPAEIDRQASALIAATARWFPPGLLAVTQEHDPENPENVYLVLDVQATGEFAQIEDRRAQWQDEAGRIISGDLSWLRLCIYPR